MLDVKYNLLRSHDGLVKKIAKKNLSSVLNLGHTYPSTRIRTFSNPQLFSFRIRLPSTRIRRIRQRIRKKNPLSRVEKNKSATNPITCGRVNPDIFECDDVKSVSSLSPNNKPIWRHNVSGEQNKFPATISPYGACSEEILVQRSLGY